jgi:hypothetical protein
MKLVVNMVMSTMMASLSEGLTLSEAMGLKIGNSPDQTEPKTRETPLETLNQLESQNRDGWSFPEGNTMNPKP